MIQGTHSSFPANTQTFAPAMTSATVIASPIPRLPPVTKALLPSRSFGRNGRIGSGGPRPRTGFVSNPLSCASAMTSSPTFPPVPAPPRSWSCIASRRTKLNVPCINSSLKPNQIAELNAEETMLIISRQWEHCLDLIFVVTDRSKTVQKKTCLERILVRTVCGQPI